VDPPIASAAPFTGPEYLDPDIPELRDARGYAVSHFAGNRQVFDRPKPLASAELTVGASNTILAGECASNFKAWDDPANLRDPAQGINKTPDGFGGPGGNGAHFAMVDGSVRFLSDTVDQRVLEALASTGR
jgi:prepilin-type processing-associated H-X9-DG protein